MHFLLPKYSKKFYNFECLLAVPFMLSPSDYIVQHMAHVNCAFLKPGDRVYYDLRFKSTVPTLIMFETLLSRLYKFKHISGDKSTGNMVIFEITTVKL